MTEKKRYNFITLFMNAMWIAAGIGIVVLLVAAINKRTGEVCRKVIITITGVENNLFIDTLDVRSILEKYNGHQLEETSVDRFRLSAMQEMLQKSNWVKTARLYFDNNNILKVNIIEREPIARIFCANGASFYLDSARYKLPLSSKFSARVPVVTNFPSDNIILSNEDSVLLNGVRVLTEFISRDPFWMGQIEQIDITPEKTFELIPKIGQQIILFGSAENYRQKFSDLLQFYQQVESKTGWNKYSKINLKFQHQIIAEVRGVEQVKMDSVSTIQLMKILVANALKQANDTAHNIQLLQPVDDNNILLQPHVDTIESKQTNLITTVKSSTIEPKVVMAPSAPMIKHPVITKASPVHIIHHIQKPIIKPIAKKLKPNIKTIIKSKPISAKPTNDY